MAISFESLSISSIFNSILSYFRSQENNTKWRSLSNGSEGSFLIRLLATTFNAISTRVVGQSRENFLSTATLPSSTAGISVNLGYSAYRGSNMKRLIKINPTGSYTYPKLSVIGTYSSEYDIITLEDVALEEDVTAEVKTVIGKVKEVTLTTGTSAVKVFSLFTTGISEDFVLYKDSTEVPTTDIIKEMTDDKYLVRTNPFKSVDIMYLNSYPDFQYKYGTGTELTIRYVELADTGNLVYTEDMFTCGTLQGSTLISSYLPFETAEEMKVNAPLDHELQNLIRSKADYAKRFQLVVPTIIDNEFKALTPTYTQVSYLKDDLSLLTDTEKASVKEVLSQENFFGTPLPDITVPRREVADLEISIALTSKYKNVADIKLDIDNILGNNYNYSLGLTFDTYSLEKEIEALSYVKYARVGHKINSRVTGSSYQIGYTLYHNENYYMATKILGVTGSTAPNWLNGQIVTSQTDIDLGIEIEDGSIIWRAYKRLPNMSDDALSAWRSNFQYGIGDFVYTSDLPNYMFKCVDLIKSSGTTMPDISSASKGDFVVDGSLVWVVKDYTDASTWTSYTNYRLGSSVNVSSTDYSLECISYIGATGTDKDLEFELPIYTITSKTANSFSVAGNKVFYLREGDVISVASPDGYQTFSITNTVFDASTASTVITVNQAVDVGVDYTQIIASSRGTRDGQILWEIIEDVDNISYPWNSYVTFAYTLDIVGQ